MPNWTYNNVRITGEKNVLAKMLNDAVKNEEDGELHFSSWFPIPETYKKYDTTNHPNGERLVVGRPFYDMNGGNTIATEELIAEYKRATAEQYRKYQAVGWYQYNCKYFGCKWDMEINVNEVADDEIIIDCQSPWTAPDQWLFRMSERYPELSFKVYSEYEEGDWEEYFLQAGYQSEYAEGKVECEEED